MKNVLAVLFFLVAPLLYANEIQREDKIYVEPSDIVDFKNHPADETQTRMVRITNAGQDKLLFGMVRTSCSCLAGTLSKQILNVGESADLTLTLQGGELQGEYSKNVYVMLPDSDKKYLKLDVRGNALSNLVPMNKTDDILASDVGDGTVLVEYFYRSDCLECVKITEEILPELEKTCKGKYRLSRQELSVEENFRRLLSRLDSIGDKSSNEKIYVILNKKKIIAGGTAVRKELTASVLKMAETPEKIIAKSELFDYECIANRIRLGTVLLAGLVDGINPCVFATMIFFMSLLIAARTKRRHLIVVAMIYTAACFLTYFLLGLGLFRFLGWTGGIPFLRLLLNTGIALTLFVFSILSFRDAVIFLKTDDSESVMLRIPNRFRDRIHQWMRSVKHGKFLLPGIFVLGVSVTLLESVCSGQVYVPTLLLLIQEDGMASGWFFYLLLYNMMFILPLVVLFVLVLCGITLRGLLKLGRKELFLSKIFLGILFLFFAILLIYFEFFL